MPEYLQTTIDKFTFKVATDRRYSGDGIWLQETADGRLRVGVTDFVQQHSGDVAFASVKATGTTLSAGDEFAELETVKVNLSLPLPVAGTIVEVNPALDTTPEVVNQAPYGDGWLAVVEVPAGAIDRVGLLDPPAYFAVMRSQVEQELNQQ
jgi:glycine cleavage system H protein